MSENNQVDYKKEDPVMDDEEGKIDLIAVLESLLTGMRVLWPLWILLILLCAGYGYYQAARSYSPYYVSEATFTVEVDYGEGTYDYNNSTTASSLATLFPYLLTSTQLSELVAEDLGLTYVPGSISASVIEGTNFFTLTVTASDPQMAYDILVSVIDQYPKIAEKVVGFTTLTMVSEPVVPDEPANSFNPLRSIQSGAMTGFLAGALLVVLYGLTRNTVRGEESLKRYTNQKCLGSIGQVKQKRYAKAKRKYMMVTDRKVDYNFRESFRSIVSRLLRSMKKHGAKSLMVTSALQGEGKTTITMNLALTMAEAGQRKVILMDCDLRKPATTEALMGRKKAEYTIYDVLNGTAQLEEALIPIRESGVWLLAGDSRTFDHAAEISGSEELKKLIQEAKELGDYVIIDTPPVDMMGDAFSIAQMVDGILLVVRYHYANRNAVLNALRLMDSADSRLYGYVINGQVSPISQRISGYQYGYGYGYGSYSRKSGYGYGEKKNSSKS